MADQKISQLTELTTPVGEDLLAIVDDPAGTPVTKKITRRNMIGQREINTQAASYTLVAADQGKIVQMNNGSANNLTVPLNSSVAFPVGTVIGVVQLGAGATTIVATGGVTINVDANFTLVLKAQYAVAILIKRDTDTWVLAGDLTSA